MKELVSGWVAFLFSYRDITVDATHKILLDLSTGYEVLVSPLRHGKYRITIHCDTVDLELRIDSGQHLGDEILQALFRLTRANSKL